MDFPSGTHNQNVRQIREVSVNLPNLATEPADDVTFVLVEPSLVSSWAGRRLYQAGLAQYKWAMEPDDK
jgi:hypothetical protein